MQFHSQTQSDKVMCSKQKHWDWERRVQGYKAIGILLADPITTIPGQVASPGQPNIGGAQASPTSQSGSAAQYPAQHTPATRTMPNW